MVQRIRVVYRDGAFVPLEPFSAPDNTEADVLIERPEIAPPVISEPAARAALLERLVERIRRNPLPSDAPRFTRDELHERR